MSPPKPARKLLVSKTIFVGTGSVPPSWLNIFEKVGTTKIMITAITKTAIDVTTRGYIIAPLTFFLSFMVFSI